MQMKDQGSFYDIESPMSHARPAEQCDKHAVIIVLLDFDSYAAKLKLFLKRISTLVQAFCGEREGLPNAA